MRSSERWVRLASIPIVIGAVFLFVEIRWKCNSEKAAAKIEELLGIEDERICGGAALTSAVTSSDSRVRARAAVALGRIMKPETIPTLLDLLKDERAAVRLEALFAAGQLGLVPEGLKEGDAGLLINDVKLKLSSEDEQARARAVEALGKLAGDKAPLLVAPFLKDVSAAVRRQAASACFRWRQVLRWRDPTAKPPDMPKEVVQALCDAAGDADPEVRWRAIHALVRSGSSPEAAAIKRFLEDKEPLCRVFALNLIERLKTKDLANEAASAQQDGDAQVRQASLRVLFALERPDLLSKELANDPSHHVRESVADLVADEGAFLDGLSQDKSPAVRSAALLARVRISGERALPSVERALSDENPVLRVAAAKGAGHMKAAGLPLLRKACKDDLEEVRAAALVMLGDIEGDMAWTAIKEGLVAKGIGERGSAVEALGKRKEPEATAAAIECFKNSSGREWVEIRESIVDQLAARPPEATTEFLVEIAQTETVPSVRQKAVAALDKRKVLPMAQNKGGATTRSPHAARRFKSNPVVILETTKGTLEIECFASEAPIHVANFVGLVEKGFYNGLKWHRVVPNFVIQGGDPLGNGWGDAGWSLRAEINAIPYKRGTLGMPRSAGFDTGGSQIFITHLPTPHLDGYYTVFGQVTQGLDVIDRIEIGDRIVKARLK